MNTNNTTTKTIDDERQPRLRMEHRVLFTVGGITAYHLHYYLKAKGWTTPPGNIPPWQAILDKWGETFHVLNRDERVYALERDTPEPVIQLMLAVQNGDAETVIAIMQTLGVTPP